MITTKPTKLLELLYMMKTNQFRSSIMFPHQGTAMGENDEGAGDAMTKPQSFFFSLTVV